VNENNIKEKQKNKLNTRIWRLATLPQKAVPSLLLGLTSVFGMGTGISPATNHQIQMLNFITEVQITGNK